MSEEIGLRRHVAFADPRLERSTAIKCTEADHYISTTARSDICVLPVCLSLFKSPSWTALEIRLVNQDPVSFTNQCCCFRNQTFIFKYAFPYLFGHIFTLILKFIFFHIILFHSPFLYFSLYVCEWLLCWGLYASWMCLDQFCSICAVSFLLKCMGRSTKKRSRVRLHFNKAPSLSSLMLPCTLATKKRCSCHWELK